MTGWSNYYAELKKKINQVEEVRFTFIVYLAFRTLGKYEQQFNFLEFFDW